MTADEPTAKRSEKAAEEDQFTKASAIVAARSFGASPHEMAGALWDKADDDSLTRQQITKAVAAVRKGPEEG